MNRERLTNERIKRFSCPEGKRQDFLWDSEMPRLAVRATAAGAKSFIFETKLERQTIRMTIGSVGVWNLDDARVEARRLQTIVDAGRDPRQVKAEITSADEAARAAAIASKEAAEVEAQRQQLTLGEAWAVYCETRRPKWGDRHYRDHRNLIQAAEARPNGKTTTAGVLASLAAEPLGNVTRGRVAEWVEAETAKRPTQAALGYRLLRGFLNWADQHPNFAGLVEPSACCAAVSREHVAKPKAKTDALQREQLRPWFDAVRRISNRTIAAYLQILLLVGCRREELATLQWRNVDFEWNSLTIRDKVEGERTIPLTPYVRGLLLELWNLRDRPPTPRHLKAMQQRGETWQPSPWVFSSKTAADGRMQEPRIAHNKALTAAGLPPVSLHGLRRSFGSLSEWCECPVGVVAQIQGHKPSATAEKHYRVRPLDLLRMWHTKIEGWVLEQAGIEQPKQGALTLSIAASA